MTIIVCLKQVPDTDAKITLESEESGINTSSIKWIINPYDEYAIEEALQAQKHYPDSKVIALCLGPKSRTITALRSALAMGADEAIALDCPDQPDSITTAKALAKVIQTEAPDGQLVFTGRLSVDINNEAVGIMLAQLLGFSHASAVTKTEYSSSLIHVVRDSDGGTKEHFELNLPALITTNKGLNSPRMASLPNIMKAKKKPLKEISFDSIGLSDATQKVVLSRFTLPKERPPAKILAGEIQEQTSTLVHLLRAEAKII